MSDLNPRVTRRRFLGQLAAGAGAVALAACGQDPRERQTGGGAASSSTQVAAPAASAAPAPVGPVQFMNWDPIEGTPIEAVIQAYQKQTGRTVEVIPTPGAGAEYETKVRTMLAGGAIADIMRTNDDYVRYYSIKDQVRDLTPYLKRDNINAADYYASIYDFAKQPDGKYTAWSLGNQPRLSFYKVNAFKEAGV